MTKQRINKSPTIASLEFLYSKNEIRIPEVQRDLVWSKSQKQLLIDSLIKDYDIPKLYFRDIEETNEAGNPRTVFYVIDGQQRLFTILEFLQDKFELPKDEDNFGNDIIAKKKFSELSTDLQIELRNRELDIVHLVGYTDDEIDETFLRLQNGTPLKAAEKRRAIAGEMRNVVKDLSQHEIYNSKYCDFSNKHFAYEDSAAKVLKSVFEGGATPISAQQMSKFFEDNPTIQITDSQPKAVKTVFNFLVKSFKNSPSPHFRMYALMDIATVVHSMLNTYDLSKYPGEFAKVYLDFLDLRAADNEKEEEDRDPKLIAYANAARADGLEQMLYRQNLIKEYFLDNMTYLALKDNNRNFTPDQRAAIYRKNHGVCQMCGKEVSEDEFEADHIIPWSHGGPTQIANGQVLCATCNRSKNDSMPETSN